MAQKSPRPFLPKRWIVERTSSWLSQNRRMSLATTSGWRRAEKPSFTWPSVALWRGDLLALETFQTVSRRSTLAKIESGRGRYAPRPSAQRETSYRRAYTLLSDLGQEGRSALKWATLRLLAPSAWGYPFGSASTARVPLRAHKETVCEGQRLFACRLRAHQPEESLRAFMDPLADAVSCATKWLKSSNANFGEYAS